MAQTGRFFALARHLLIGLHVRSDSDLGDTMTPVSPTALLQLRNTILSQNGALQRAAGTPGAPVEAGGFGDALMDAVKAVNSQQAKASEASASYERGETNDIVGVMLARQQASLGFEATLQVRNKLLGAYRDIMNMPV